MHKEIDANVCLTKMYLRIKFKSLICRTAVIDTLKKAELLYLYNVLVPEPKSF